MEKAELQKYLGVNLQKARAERNMTREQLAEKAGISPTFLANLECGNKMMSVMTLMHLADALSVSVDMLVRADSSDMQMKNIEILLRDQPVELIRYIEKLTHLSIEYLTDMCSDAEDDTDPHKEVQPDVSAE